jgi:hypothetical protein
MADRAPTVQIYFEPKMKPVFKKLMKLNKETGISVSKIAYYALQVGLPSVAENLKGLPIDFQAEMEYNEKHSKLK